MRAGRLTRRVNIQAQTKTVDATSWLDANAQTWTTVKSVMAGIEPLSGNEQLRSDQVRGETLLKVVMRYHSYPTLTTKNRLQYTIDGTTYTLNIEQALNKNTRRREWELLCSEGVSDG